MIKNISIFILTLVVILAFTSCNLMPPGNYDNNTNPHTAQTTVSPSAYAPTPIVIPTPQNTDDPNAGMIFPDSDTRIIMTKELQPLSIEDLNIAKNEIYARMGCSFKNDFDSLAYFSKFSWYKEDSDFSESKFSDIQKANIGLLNIYIDLMNGKPTLATSGMKLDFDQDGELETLKYVIHNDDEDPSSSYVGILFVDKNISITKRLENILTANDNVYVTDINEDDNRIDVLCDGSFEDDYSKMGIFQLDSSNQIHYQELDEKIDSMKVLGNGMVSFNSWLNFLFMFGADVKYKFDLNGIPKFVKDDWYDMGNISGTTAVSLTLYKTNDKSVQNNTYKIPSKTKLTFIKTDLVHWIQVKQNNGTVGWLYMYDQDKISANLFGEEAFLEGLPFMP